jgi:hypothetical protein
MPNQEKNTTIRNTHLMIFLPVAGNLFGKKTSSEMLQHNGLDFHLEMIKKIDKLLAEHDEETSDTPVFHTPPIIPPQPPTPIEPRPPLNKTFPHEELRWEPVSQHLRPPMQTIPEEFKTELSITPEFRFITSQEFIETISQTQPSSEDRVEIIDISTLTGDTTPAQRTMNRLNQKNQDNETPVSTLRKQELEKEECDNKKVEVIDAGTLKKKIDEATYTTANEQTDQIEKKAKVYFLNKKDSTDKNQKKQGKEQSYLPDDIEERFKVLREKKKKEEEEQKRLDEEKRLRELQVEQEKRKKEEEQRRVDEEKRFRELQVEQEKQRKEEEKRRAEEVKRFRELQVEQEKQRKEEEKRRAEEVKRLRELQVEQEKQRKEEEKRRAEEEKRQKKLQDEQEQPETPPRHHPQKTEDVEEEPLSLETIALNKTTSDLKRELKEQKRLHQLAIRKARIEERQRKKEEKQALKLQRKHEHLKPELSEKFEKQPPSPPQTEKQDSSGEQLDEDIRKVLLITDYLLGELPEEVLNIFLESEEFELYEKVLNKYKIK